jgi:transposase-like protein
MSIFNELQKRISSKKSATVQKIAPDIGTVKMKGKNIYRKRNIVQEKQHLEVILKIQNNFSGHLQTTTRYIRRN